MNPIRALRQWWQRTTGEEETPFDGDAPTWVVSMLFHMALLLALASFPSQIYEEPEELLIVSEQVVEEEEEVIDIPDFAFDPLEQDLIGSNGEDLTDLSADSFGPTVDDIFNEQSVDLPVTTIDPILEANVAIEEATGRNFSETLTIKGDAGSSAEAAAGAIDRITHEIMLSLDQRKTHVVWLFDQTASLEETRETFVERIEKIYEELGVIEASGAEQFAKHDELPLTTSIVGFGNNVTLFTPEPTDNLSEIVDAVRNMPDDDSGVERVFSAIYTAANKFKHFRLQEGGRDPKRNVMLIVLTDEAGDDVAGLEETVKVCRRYSMPVYVIGVPAPFGRKETYVKWVDPDPNYDQTPQWAPIDQGPESLEPEGIRLSFGAGRGEEEPIIDSGFGPFALTRLCYETGGIYFTVHPNRDVTRAVSRRETDAFAAHLEHFFDPTVMRRYRPDYVSRDEYMRRVQSSQMRSALVQAAKMSWLESIDQPTLTFVKRDEAAFVVALTNAQRDAAKFSPKIDMLHQVLRIGEADREKETSPRWQAGFDLAYGRVLAAKVRAEAMNAMLAEAKRGLKAKDEKSNTWTLTPSDEVTVDSQLAAMAEKARTLLTGVTRDHAGTPWALLAQKELDMPLGWTWEESYTAPPEPARMTPANPNPVVNPNPNRPAEQRRMIDRPTPRRAPPRL